MNVKFDKCYKMELTVYYGKPNRDILNLTGTTNLGQGRPYFRNNISSDLGKNSVMNRRKF